MNREDSSRGRKRRLGLVTCFALVFVTQVLGALMGTPVLRLLEMSACYRYYRGHDPKNISNDGNVPEALCKVAEVQKEVAFVHSMLYFIASLISLIVTVPYGLVVDRYGRKVVLCLNLGAEVAFYTIVGIIGYFPDIFPARAYILTATLQLVGGGGKVVTAIIYSIMTDISTEEERTTLFYYLELVDYGTQLIVPAVVSLIMTFSIWVPFAAGVFISAASFTTALFLPETAKGAQAYPKDIQGNVWEQEELLANAEQTQIVPENSQSAGPQPEARQHDASRLEQTETSHQETGTTAPEEQGFVCSIGSTSLLKLRKGGLIPAIVFLVVISLWSIAWTSHLFFQQYASQRFGITLAQSGFIVSYKALVNVLLFWFALPRVRSLLIGESVMTTVETPDSASFYHATARRGTSVDLVILRGSALVLALGSLWISLADGKVLYLLGITIVALGDGFNATAQALTITLADPSAVNQICSWFALVTTAGRAAGRQIMMYSFQMAADADESSFAIVRGLPFAVAGVFYTATFLVLYVPLRFPPPLNARKEDVPDNIQPH